MNAGDLDRRVQFLRAVLSDDGIAQVETWANHGASVWASRRFVSDSERVVAAQVGAIMTARFVVRATPFSRGLTPEDRLICEGSTFDITGIKEIGRMFREITASARADTDD